MLSICHDIENIMVLNRSHILRYDAIPNVTALSLHEDGVVNGAAAAAATSSSLQDAEDSTTSKQLSDSNSNNSITNEGDSSDSDWT
jgi:hypothetical protein